jgi:hypothetical protein
VGPEVAGIGFSLASPGVRERLARVAGGQDVHWFDDGPVDGGEVVEVGDVGPVVFEDLRGVGVVFGVPGHMGVGEQG